MDSRLERRCTIALQAYGRATGHVAERAGDKPVEGADASDITRAAGPSRCACDAE